jgi:putative aminopeptidase FrvX
VQLLHEGIAAIDLGFPCRYTHSSLEVCDPADLANLTQLLIAGITRIDQAFSLDRDRYT